MKKLLTLPNLILASLLAGLLFGLALGERIQEIAWLNEALRLGGDLFKQLIKMVILPLVFVSLVTGMMSIGDARRLGRVAAKTLAIYATTAALACTLALLLANAARPGTRVPEETRRKLAQEYETQRKDVTAPLLGDAGRQNRPTFAKFARSLVPSNIVDALVREQMLQVIFFALFFGLAAATIESGRRDRLQDLFGALGDVVIRMVGAVMWTAPVGVFCLIAVGVSSLGFSVFRALGLYCAVVVAALALQFFAVYGGALRLLTRLSFRDFLKACRPALLTAFGTSSSAAALPANLECMSRRLNISGAVSSFVLPLGTTVNMDGTAIMQSVAAVFIAQLYSIPLDLTAQLTIVLTAMLAAIGTAPVPSAGIAMLVVILEPLGIPLEGIALVWAVDRPLDMLRTVVNVMGDGVAAAGVASWEGEDVKYVPYSA